MKKDKPSLPIIMGGPNIRIDSKGIEEFLRNTLFKNITNDIYNHEINVM